MKGDQMEHFWRAVLWEPIPKFSQVVRSLPIYAFLNKARKYLEFIKLSTHTGFIS